jgi:hypothetical protein
MTCPNNIKSECHCEPCNACNCCTAYAKTLKGTADVLAVSKKPATVMVGTCTVNGDNKVTDMTLVVPDDDTWTFSLNGKPLPAAFKTMRCHLYHYQSEHLRDIFVNRGKTSEAGQTIYTFTLGSGDKAMGKNGKRTHKILEPVLSALVASGGSQATDVSVDLALWFHSNNTVNPKDTRKDCYVTVPVKFAVKRA